MDYAQLARHPTRGESSVIEYFKFDILFKTINILKYELNNRYEHNISQTTN